MCGILCEVCYAKTTPTKDVEVLKRIHNRGPDYTKTLEIDLQDGNTIFFCASILWMQGPKLFPQPVENDQGVLLYNGDIFDETWDSNINDTQLIMEKITQETFQTTENVIEKLKLLKGPFALIYYDKANNNLYFTRDRIGRTSLLLYSKDNSFIISNVLGKDYDCVEIPASYIQVLNLTTKKMSHYPWNDKIELTKELLLDDWVDLLKLQQSLPDDEFNFYCGDEDLTDKDNVIEYIESTAKQMTCKLGVLTQLLQHITIKEMVFNVVKLLEKSVELRLKRQPNKCKECIGNVRFCNHCTVGVLFSGGIDCTILALLADKYLPKYQSVDLINVAFKKEQDASYDVPDRITGRQSLQELQKLCPERKWIFREVNIPREEMKKYQDSTIGDLVYPRQTILDESLGTALWFAARGQDSEKTSTSRVVLVGSGADELFGGYIRHRNAYKRNGWNGLSKELQLDWERISFRNLARDNRVICDHGRQPRMPYLDDDFSNYVLQLKPWLRCFPSEELGIGVGDKLLLRLVAISLGLTEVVVLPKRALQFGSRIANKKEKGNEISKTFLKNKQI